MRKRDKEVTVVKKKIEDEKEMLRSGKSVGFRADRSGFEF